MALAAQTMVSSNVQRGLLRRLSQSPATSPSNAIVQNEDFCRSQSGLVELEKELYSLANGEATAHDTLQMCTSLLSSCDSTSEVFKVFCSCSWAEQFSAPAIAKLFYKLVHLQQDSNKASSFLLLAELETACEGLLMVLTHLGSPTTLQFCVVPLLYNLSRLKELPSSHREAVESYLEEIARAFWPYCMPTGPNLWASEEFCDAQCDVLKACGKMLEVRCPVNTQRTFQVISAKLISGDISHYSRFRLLEIQELRSSGWKLSKATIDYYKTAYSKFLSQSRKDLLLGKHCGASPKNGIKRTLSDELNQNNKPSETVTILRISESELQSTCRNNTVVKLSKEKETTQDPSVCTSDDCDGFLSKQLESLHISDDNGKNILGEKRVSPPYEPSDGHFPKMVPALHRADLNKPRRPSKEATRVYETVADPLSNVLESPTERSASPTGSNGSDDVFADKDEDTSAVEFSSGSNARVVPALHRADFSKPRRPTKSDSAVPAKTEGLQARANVLSDSHVEECRGESSMISNSPAEELSEQERPSLLKSTSEGGPVNTAVSTIVEKECDIKPSTVLESSTESSPKENWRWRERKTISLTESEGDNASESSQQENWRERPLVNNANDCQQQNENWRGRRSMSLTESEGKNASESSAKENWRERPVVDNVDDCLQKERWGQKRSTSLKESEGDNARESSSKEHWREQPVVNDADACQLQKENWRERRSTSFRESEGDNACESSLQENWRDKPSGSSSVFGSGNTGVSSVRENWRHIRSQSMEEPKRDGFAVGVDTCSRRLNSSGGFTVGRQDSDEKGRRTSGGGFGLPKQDSPVSSSDEISKPEVHLLEVQLNEEESQGLRWRKLAEIQIDCNCKIFHNREKHVIEIRGDPQQCKVAKKRVYSVVAAIDEEFGALVPLSEEILDQLHEEGRNVLAERLAMCSGATVKLISDTQLFISGYRTCVDLAKAQLAKIKVMLRYTGDPDVISLDQQDKSEGERQQVSKLFAALDGRPQARRRSLDQSRFMYTATDVGHTPELPPCEGSLSREFLLSFAQSPEANQRPADLSLQRQEDWVKDIVLVTGRRGSQVATKKGFGSPTTRTPSE